MRAHYGNLESHVEFVQCIGDFLDLWPIAVTSHQNPDAGLFVCHDDVTFVLHFAVCRHEEIGMTLIRFRLTRCRRLGRCRVIPSLRQRVKQANLARAR